MVSKFTRTNSAVTCTRCSLALILILEYFTPEVHLSHVRLQVSALGEMARNEGFLLMLVPETSAVPFPWLVTHCTEGFLGG